MHRQVNIPHITTAFITLILFALLIFTTDGSSVSTAASSAPESFEQADDFNQPTRSAQDQQAEYDQQVTPRFTLVLLPTATRTPTPIKLGNFVWDDLDKDGRQDAGEPGIPGVTVQLWNSTKTSLYAQTTTNASGIYSLTAPLPGQYRIRVLLPGPNDQFTLMDQAGGDNQLDSDIFPSGTHTGFTDTITIASNVISMTNIDAGIIVYRPPTPTRTPTPINLGNFVWNDYNGNGIQDAGEDGLVGITVQLWNNAKTHLYSQTQTNASGIYSLTAPIPGQYRIRVLAPAGAGFTLKDQGVDDTRDSDISPIGPNTGFTDTIFIASNVISITKIDAGLINVPATPTPTQTFTPSQTPTSTEPVAEETLVRPAGIDTLAIFGKKDKTFTLIDTLDTNPPSSSFMIYLSSAPKKGKFIMGDWDGDGQQTPALFKKGTLWYTNQIGAAAVWQSVQLEDYGKIAVVAGRFHPAFTNDCFGVVQMKNVPEGHNFALRYTCELLTASPPSGIQTQWIDINLKGSGKYQFVAGDWNGDGLDSIAVRRDKKIKWGNVTPASGAAVFTAVQKFKTPDANYGTLISGDWNNDGIDTFGIFVKQSRAFYYRDDLSKPKVAPFVQQLGINIKKPIASSWRKTHLLPASQAGDQMPLPDIPDVPDVLDLPAIPVPSTPER